MSFTFAVERGLTLLENSLALPEPMADADRKVLGLSPAGSARPNRKRGAK